jgi:hypothetical protein
MKTVNAENMGDLQVTLTIVAQKTIFWMRQWFARRVVTSRLAPP